MLTGLLSPLVPISSKMLRGSVLAKGKNKTTLKYIQKMYYRFSMVHTQEFRPRSKKAFSQCYKDEQGKKKDFNTKITGLFKSDFFFLFAWLPRRVIIKSLIKLIKDSN